MAEQHNGIIQVGTNKLRDRYEMIVSLYNRDFIVGIKKDTAQGIYLNKELLHCAVKAYFDDIERYKAYAGSEFADSHKQAAYTIKWLNRFKPIQIREDAKTDTETLSINATFALTVGFTFLHRSVIERMTDRFFRHLVYTLTYREPTGKSLATLMYAIECATKNGGNI